MLRMDNRRQQMAFYLKQMRRQTMEMSSDGTVAEVEDSHPWAGNTCNFQWIPEATNQWR